MDGGGLSLRRTAPASAVNYIYYYYLFIYYYSLCRRRYAFINYFIYYLFSKLFPKQRGRESVDDNEEIRGYAD